MATSIGKLKQGDTLAFYIDLEAGGSPIVGAESKLRCQVRDKKMSALYGELTITADANTQGRYLVQTTTRGETQDWAPGEATLDIQYTDGNIVKSTETLLITIEKDVTRDE